MLFILFSSCNFPIMNPATIHLFAFHYQKGSAVTLRLAIAVSQHTVGAEQVSLQSGDNSGHQRGELLDDGDVVTQRTHS